MYIQGWEEDKEEQNGFCYCRGNEEKSSGIEGNGAGRLIGKGRRVRLSGDIDRKWFR